MEPNNLIKEKSNYLKQHAYNPVNWYPWCDEAFNKAKEMNKPIFLSIGYSTCHWCHVMSKESFEDKNIAELLNDTFVCIKVDKEERPDIDDLYMRFCYALTGNGGWPLTIIMTPDKKPFFAATYLPKKSIGNRIGMIELIQRIKIIWNMKQSYINIAADELIMMLKNINENRVSQVINEENIEKTYEQLCNNYDSEYGGFSIAPKFPTPNYLDFLLHYWGKTKNSYALKMVEDTLINMRAGGIYDQIGYGFHRYSTDSEWNIPHYEKMLYDQALILDIYIDTYFATHNKIYLKLSKEICTYVFNNLLSPEGAFYSAEDADSEGIEGKYYLWDNEEFNSILNDEEANFAKKLFKVDDENNNKVGSYLKVLRMDKNFIQSWANDNVEFSEEYLKYDVIREKLYVARLKRIAPYKEKRILTDWNSLMIASLAKVSRCFNEDLYLCKTKEALKFVLDNMMDDKVTLFHIYCDGEASIPGKLDDYAFLIHALIEMYQTIFDIELIKIAILLVKHLMNHFWDKQNGGFYSTADYDSDLIMRVKNYYDSAVPSANSIMCLNLLRLAIITGESFYRDAYEIIIRNLPQYVVQSGPSIAKLLIALNYDLSESYVLIIACKNKKEEKITELINLIRKNYFNRLMIIMLEEKDEEIKKIAPYLTSFKLINNKSTFYLCYNKVCKPPTNDIDEILKYMTMQ